MKQSKPKDEVMARHEDNAADSLLYWVNCTMTMCSPNFAVNMLLQAMKELLEKAVKPDQVDRVEEILTAELVKTYDYIRSSAMEPGGIEEDFADLSKDDDKGLPPPRKKDMH